MRTCFTIIDDAAHEAAHKCYQLTSDAYADEIESSGNIFASISVQISRHTNTTDSVMVTEVTQSAKNLKLPSAFSN